MERLCENCPEHETCKKTCKAVNDILWKGNRVMERHYSDRIVCYPRNGEIHFSELDIKGIENEDDFSIHDVIPWTSEDRRLMKTKVFIERFFHKVPCKELAEKYGVKVNTIICMYRDAVGTIGKIIDQMDARRAGIKATKSRGFTEDQKMFLLVSVFGFSGSEVAQMFNRNRGTVNAKVKRLSDRYRAAFAPPRSALDGMTKEQIMERMAF